MANQLPCYHHKVIEKPMETGAVNFSPRPRRTPWLSFRSLQRRRGRLSLIQHPETSQDISRSKPVINLVREDFVRIALGLETYMLFSHRIFLIDRAKRDAPNLTEDRSTKRAKPRRLEYAFGGK